MSQHRGVSRQCQLILRTVPSRIDRTRREEKSRVEGRKFPTSSPSPSFSLERAISRIQLRSDQRDMWSTCRRRRKWKWAGDPSSSPEKPSHLFAISAHGRAIFPDFSFSFFFIVRLITIPPFVISISHSYVEIQSRRSLSTEHDELSLPSFIEFEGPPLFQTPILPYGCTGIRNIEGRRESKRSRESPCNDTSYTEIFQRLYRDDSGRVRGFIAGPVI